MNTSNRTIVLTAITTATIMVGFYLLIHITLHNLGNDDRVIAIIDFLSAFLSSILSAVIAYFIAKFQIDKSTATLEAERIRNAKKVESDNELRCKILLTELEDNKHQIDLAKKDLGSDDYMAAINMTKSSLSLMAWNALMTQISLTDLNLSAIYKAYKSINMLINYDKSSTQEDMTQVINTVSKRLDGAISALKTDK
ncbi:hypothetical protein [Loigolactobacillus coryniformis]|uniref:Uncharacterized protein n=2 Tax=Loigolactobacillus coryniformis TaxID=1610 RepID=A0A2D1KN12_9LACO|nr:hypothetical protein [Loigolactobacillus coryniformis]ATO43422.1 hypothetical protein LC20004_05655 [Loigolactobacillus coryniformis subsp. torquens DSM 20004 = KCTC 3535]KRK85526.1 hypothetical protein FC16_GL001484 [Loigolactobacillus coryniformis subsp. torquens DSM 20004 = KCTC 3535]